MSDTKSTRIKDVLEQLSDALTLSIRASLATFDLDNTALSESIETEVEDPDTITAYMNEYGKYVISGRRKFVKKVPIAALLVWIAKKGIQGRNKKGRFISRNSLAFAIQAAIYKNGIKPRDFAKDAVSSEFLAMAETSILQALEAEFERIF